MGHVTRTVIVRCENCGEPLGIEFGPSTGGDRSTLGVRRVYMVNGKKQPAFKALKQ